MSYNRAIILGNLTRDVELRYTKSNTPVASVGVATNHRYKTAAGEHKEEATFIDCVAFGKTAETMSQYLAKGRPVLVEGRLKTETWQDKADGANRSKLVVVVDSFTFVGGKSDELTKPAAAPKRAAPVGAHPSRTSAAIDESDIPFSPIADGDARRGGGF